MTALRLLTVTTLFPNQAQPTHGIFVENRLRHLLATGEVTARVVAPVPWFPLRSSRFGAYGLYPTIPSEEIRHGVIVSHPRFLAIPRIGMSAAPFLLYAALLGHVRRLLEEGVTFDLIDAHYFYPDGVAALLLGRKLGKPVVITARGTDLNLVPSYRLPRRLIRWAAMEADGVITVCQALKEVLVSFGLPPERAVVLRNGVDLAQFTPGDRKAARRTLGFETTRPIIASVGLLITRKGHDLIIRALADLPDVELLIAGAGPEQSALERLAIEVGVADRVHLLGSVSPARMKDVYRAADALVLASSREGWANVLLEAMACGTPVVASAVWGTPEVVAAPAAGLLLPERSPAAIAATVRALLTTLPDRTETRRYAEQFSWDSTSEGQLRLFQKIFGRIQSAVTS
ncbi:MAG: glycosyltransferase family 4 protein [Rhodospirillaceae bacterium]